MLKRMKRNIPEYSWQSCKTINGVLIRMCPASSKRVPHTCPECEYKSKETDAYISMARVKKVEIRLNTPDEPALPMI